MQCPLWELFSIYTKNSTSCYNYLFEWAALLLLSLRRSDTNRLDIPTATTSNLPTTTSTNHRTNPNVILLIFPPLSPTRPLIASILTTRIGQQLNWPSMSQTCADVTAICSKRTKDSTLMSRSLQPTKESSSPSPNNQFCYFPSKQAIIKPTSSRTSASNRKWHGWGSRYKS